MSERICIAAKNHEAGIRELWKSCFFEEDIFLEPYFKAFFYPRKCLLYEINNKPAAMLNMLEIEFVDEEEQKQKGMMQWAIATHPDYRNKGLASSLIKESNKLLLESGYDFATLVPANAGLFAFYEKLGYKRVFYFNERKLSYSKLLLQTKTEKKEANLDRIEAEEYNELRNLLLQGRRRIAYRDEELRLQKMIARLGGGDLYRINHSQEAGLAAIEKRDELVIVKELLLPTRDFTAFAGALLRKLPAGEYLWRTPVLIADEGQPFGMLRELCAKRDLFSGGYLGIAYD